MLWRRHFQKEKAPRKAEGRKEENAPDRKRRSSPVSVYERAETRRRMTKTEYFRQRKTKKYGVLQERYHVNDIAFLLLFYRFLTLKQYDICGLLLFYNNYNSVILIL